MTDPTSTQAINAELLAARGLIRRLVTWAVIGNWKPLVWAEARAFLDPAQAEPQPGSTEFVFPAVLDLPAIKRLIGSRGWDGALPEFVIRQLVAAAQPQPAAPPLQPDELGD